MRLESCGTHRDSNECSKVMEHPARVGSVNYMSGSKRTVNFAPDESLMMIKEELHMRKTDTLSITFK